MNLEEIEQRCLKYLMESSTPLVPVETLLRFLQRRGEFPELGEPELVDFLRHHELFRVIDPLPLPPEFGGDKALAEAGFRAQPRAVLCTRMPTARVLKEGMLEEIGKLLEALSVVLDDATAARDKEKVRQLRQMIRRAEALADRIEAME